MIFRGYPYASIGLKATIDRINSIMTGMNYHDNITHYIQTELLVPDNVSDHGLEWDWYREVESELRMMINELEFDPTYTHTMHLLSMYVGNMYTIPFASDAGIMVLIQAEE